MSTEAIEFRTLAMAFRAVANDLQRGLGELTRVRGTIRGSSYRAGGYMLSTTVLRALATECVLKALSIESTGEYRRKHDLVVLFDELNPVVARRVDNIARSRDLALPRETLERHRRDFTEWRYPPEEINSTNPSDLDSVLDVLLSVFGSAETPSSTACT